MATSVAVKMFCSFDTCRIRSRNDIYSNDGFGSPKHSAASQMSSNASTTTTTSTSLFNFTSMTSLPPRPPSFRLRSRENSATSGVSHHHPHYNHHFRDSGHASLGSTDDISSSSAPPLPPRLSCKSSAPRINLNILGQLS